MRNFRSSDFTFRPTSLGQRLADAGLIKAPSLVREPAIEVIQGNGRHVHVKAA
jgi:hypothetical protein